MNSMGCATYKRDGGDSFHDCFDAAADLHDRGTRSSASGGSEGNNLRDSRSRT